ncbi:MAG: metallophosphoesterase [Clostridia bacterium]|nr:metallophosphoesterase [Clostridia bacterium]
MAIYALGDLHLPFGREKSMEIFGEGWKNYTARIKANWEKLISPEDTVVVPGDLSWAISLEEALPDFLWLDKLPGRKLLIKGNHDYYWCSLTKMRRFLGENGIISVDFIHNSSVSVEGLSLCGTRGWFLDSGDDTHIFQRELGRLKASLSAARPGEKIVCFLHYPPLCREFDCPEIRSIMEEAGVSSCYYGHLHGASHSGAFSGMHNGIRYACVSADGVGFMPVLVRV